MGTKVKRLSNRTFIIIFTLLIIALIVADYCTAQRPYPFPDTLTSPIVDVGTAEYQIVYLYKNGTVKVASQKNYTPQMYTYPITSIKGVSGGQYRCAAWDTSGNVFILSSPAGYTPIVEQVMTDEHSNTFDDNRQVECMYSAYVSIRGNDSTLWYWGLYDPMNYNAGGNITNPIALTMPTGNRKAKKIRCVTDVVYSSIYTRLYVLCTDGTMWVYSKGNATPSQITGMDSIIDFEVTSFYSSLAVSSTNKIYAWGLYNSQYSGATIHSATPADITSQWTAAGLVFPIRGLSGNDHAMHVIDNNNNVFVSGKNTMGMLGNGNEYTPMRTLSPLPFQVDITERSSLMLESPQQLMGVKARKISSGANIVFYKHLQDLAGNWYSIGRNKAHSLGNRISLKPYGGIPTDGDYATYPNAMDWVAFKAIRPDTLTSWGYTSFSINDSLPPFVSSGVNQYITTDTTTLYGRAFQQEHRIENVSWQKVSGGTTTIVNPTSATTQIQGMQTGEYIFRFTATNSYGQVVSNDISIFVLIEEQNNRIICPCIFR